MVQLTAPSNTNEIFENGVMHTVSLPNIDEDKFDDMNDDTIRDTNILVYVHDPEEHLMPSVRFSPMMFLGLFLGFLCFAGLLGFFIIYVSRLQEKRKSTSSSRRSESTAVNALKSNLECRPWSEWGDKTVEMTDASFTINDISTSSESSSSGTDSDDDAEPPSSTTCNRCCSISNYAASDHLERGNKAKTICALCSEPFQNGQPVYKSNNPQCNHEFHMVCMDKWLNIQNTCPICNQPYILQTV